MGHQNRGIAKQLRVDRWLVPRSAGCLDLPVSEVDCRCDEASDDLSEAELKAWLDGLDIVVFVETPVFTRLVDTARQLGVRVVFIPNWEFLHPGLQWLDKVDLMLCPTRHTAELLKQWKLQYRFEWDIELVPWPIELERFHFRRRYRCGTFVCIGGTGGNAGRAADGSLIFRRKGLSVLLSAARQIPDIPIILYASPDSISYLPRNVQFRGEVANNRELYAEGDVCVQPSHWEGLGLPLLECQAAGMPLVAPAMPPMNEHRPLRLIPAVPEPAYLSDELCIPAARIQPDDLARVMRSLHGRQIFIASSRARRFVIRQHSWEAARPKLQRILTRLVSLDESVHSS